VRHNALGSDKGLTGTVSRFIPGYDMDEPGAPASLVAKFSAPEQEIRDAVHSMGFYEREVQFYAELADRTPLHTPRCYFSAIELQSGRALILLEDLIHARNGSMAAGCSLPEARLVIRELAGLHAAWWRHPLLAVTPWLQLKGPIATECVAVAFRTYWPTFLSRLESKTAQTMELGELIGAHLQPVYGFLLEEPPRTLIHNDFQADNLFFSGSGRSLSLTVIDWQLAAPGRGAVEVAHFIGGHLEPETRRAEEHELVRDYHQRLQAAGVSDYLFEDCWRDYRLAMLLPPARIATVVGRHPGMGQVKNGFWNSVFPRFCQAVFDLEVADLLPPPSPKPATALGCTVQV
jgi:hypothetical protein